MILSKANQSEILANYHITGQMAKSKISNQFNSVWASYNYKKYKISVNTVLIPCIRNEIMLGQSEFFGENLQQQKTVFFLFCFLF